MYILGISAFYHDSAVALLKDGGIVAAAQEERFTRIKHDSAFPRHSIEFCLNKAGIKLEQVDAIAFHDKPYLKFERLLETYLSFVPRGFQQFKKVMPLWLKDKLFQKDLLRKELSKLADRRISGDKILFAEHHQSHAASAFYPSPFSEAAILTMDGVGEWTTTSICQGNGSDLQILKEILFPHSLGLLYSAFTYYTGFKVNSGEYKVMGLAPYGRPLYVEAILHNILDLREDGSFWLDQKYFDYCTGFTMTTRCFHELFGGQPRRPDEPLTQRHMDLAASIQAVIEIAVIKIARYIARETGQKNLCMAGGVALNCVANGKLLRENIFERIWVQPAAGDAGGALGAALAAYYTHFKMPRCLETQLTNRDHMRGSYLGPSYESKEAAAELDMCGARYQRFDSESVIKVTANALTQGQAVGWFQGAMEFGPRALGNRSILGDPRSSSMQKDLNLKIKFRESFRPFAPSVLAEKAAEWFEMDAESPYMLMVADIRLEMRLMSKSDEESLFGIDLLNQIRSQVPAVTHVDYSARIQTVDKNVNPRFHRLLMQFFAETGCPMLINTSFNVRGEPIVATPSDAFRCFMGTDLDMLVIEDIVLYKKDQDEALKQDYKDKFELD